MYDAIKHYHWLLFDADNTLFDFDQAERLALLKTLDDYHITYSEDNIFDIYHAINHKLWQQLETGEVASQSEIKIARTKQLFDALNVNRDVPKFAEDYLYNLSQNGQLLDNAIKVVRYLSQRHRMMIITNGITSVQKPRLNQSPIADFFEHIVISQEIGYAKPSAAIFDHAFDLMEKPEKKRVAIFGDSISSDIAGGINYGIDAFWFNPNKQDIKHNATDEFNDLMSLIE